MNLNEKIWVAIEEPLQYVGYGLVRVNVVGGARTVVAIDIERLDDKAVTIDDCVEANRTISAILDVEDFIKNKYTLEVSSPGEERPLLKISDFKRFCGREAKIELHSSQDGKKKMYGRISRIEEDRSGDIVYFIEDGSSEIAICYNNIKKASVKRIF